MIDSWDVVAHVGRAVGLAELPTPMARLTQDGARGVGIITIPDVPVPGVTTWASVDASAFDTGYRTRDGRPVRVEFVAGVDSRWTFMGDAVASCAFQLGAPNAIGPGVLYRNAIGAFHPEAATPHLMAFVPQLWDRFEPFVDTDVEVGWLQLVPVTEDEAAFSLRHGVGALDEAFGRAQPDIFSIERPGVPLPNAAD